MTEIPLPPSDGYVEPSAPSKGPGCGKMLIVGLIIAIVVIGGFIVVMLPGLLNGNNTTTTTTPTTPVTTTTTSAPYDVRSITQSIRVDIDLISTTYYADEFYVSSSEVLTTTPPDLWFTVVVWDYGVDSGPVDVYIAVYETDLTTVEDAATWGELDTYLVDDGTYEADVGEYINLYNYPSTYTWVIWFEGASKTSVWEVSVYIWLRYNWDS